MKAASMLPCRREVRNTVAAMYVVPRIVHNEKIQATANSLYDLAVKWLQEIHNKE